METVNKYVNKWQHIIGNEDEQTQTVVAFILENQKNFLNKIQDSLYDEVKIAAGYGADWKNTLYRAITKAWADSHLPEMVSIQPMAGPVGGIAHYSMACSTIESDGVPTVNASINVREVQAESRKSKTSFTPDMDSSAVDAEFKKGMLEITHEIIGTMLNAARSLDNYTEALRDNSLAGGVKEALQTASTKIFQRTMRGSGNNVIGNHAMLSLLGVEQVVTDGRIKKLHTLDGKWNVYLDTHFPDNELMVWYNGPSLLDAPLVYSPYIYGFSPVGDNSFYGNYRHKITMIHPSYVQLIKLSDLRS